MTFPANPAERSPKGDHNRRIALNLDPEAFAAAAGISADELRRYEFTSPDDPFDPIIAQKIGETLERLEAVRTPRVDNGGVPDTEIASDRNAVGTAPAWPDNNTAGR